MLPWLLTGYLALLLGVTIWSRRRRGGGPAGGRDYFVAGGRLSAFTVGCSLVATSVGGSSTVLTAALVYRHGLAGLWMDIAGALGFALLGLLVAGPVRQSGACSIAELSGRRFGEGVRRAVAVTVVLAELGWLALLSRATAAVLSPTLPGVPELALLAGAVTLVVLYTLLGGQFAVAYTDIAQVGVMGLGLGVLAPLGVLSALNRRGLSLPPLRFPLAPSFGPARVGAFLVLAGLPHLVGSDIYAKVLSARDAGAARRGALLAAGAKLLFAGAIGLTALAGSALHPGLSRPDFLLGAVVRDNLAGPASALVTLALVSSMMSSADQVLLSAVTMVAHDLRPGRAMVPLSALGSGALALLLAAAAPSVVDIMKVAYTVFAAGLALPVLAGVFPALGVPRRAVLAAIVLGGSVGAGLQLAHLAGLDVPLPGDPVLWGSGLCLLTLLAGRLLGPTTPP